MAALLPGCLRAGTDAAPIASHVDLQLNQSPLEYIDRHKALINVINRPPGVHFLVTRWSEQHTGTATFKHGRQTFSIDDVLSVTAMDDTTAPAEGLVRFIVYAGISSAEWMAIPSNYRWHFHANRVYLSVTLSREPTLLDPQKPGAYLVS